MQGHTGKCLGMQRIQGHKWKYRGIQKNIGNHRGMQDNKENLRWNWYIEGRG